MTFYSIIFIVTTVMCPLAIFLFFRNYFDESEKLLKTTQVFTIIAIVGVATVIVLKGQNSFLISLINPLLSISIYKIMSTYFYKRFHRKPINTGLNIQQGTNWDRAFNIIYVLMNLIGLLIFTLFSIYIIENIY